MSFDLPSSPTLRDTVDVVASLLIVAQLWAKIEISRVGRTICSKTIADQH